MKTDDTARVEQEFLEVLERSRPDSVQELLEELQRSRGISGEDGLKVLKKLEEEGEIELEAQPQDIGSYLKYLGSVRFNLWFYLLLTVLLASTGSFYLLPKIYPYAILRWIGGIAFTLFVAGYAVVQVAFLDNRELNQIERLAVATGLSVIITPLLTIVISTTPWGIRFEPIIVVFSIFTISVSLIATHRRYLRDRLRISTLRRR